MKEVPLGASVSQDREIASGDDKLIFVTTAVTMKIQEHNFHAFTVRPTAMHCYITLYTVTCMLFILPLRTCVSERLQATWCEHVKVAILTTQKSLGYI